MKANNKNVVNVPVKIHSRKYVRITTNEQISHLPHEEFDHVISSTHTIDDGLPNENSQNCSVQIPAGNTVIHNPTLQSDIHSKTQSESISENCNLIHQSTQANSEKKMLLVHIPLLNNPNTKFVGNWVSLSKTRKKMKQLLTLKIDACETRAKFQNN